MNQHLQLPPQIASGRVHDGSGLQHGKKAGPHLRHNGRATVTVPAVVVDNRGKLTGGRDQPTTLFMTTSDVPTMRGKAQRHLGLLEYRLVDLSIEPLSAQTVKA